MVVNFYAISREHSTHPLWMDKKENFSVSDESVCGSYQTSLIRIRTFVRHNLVAQVRAWGDEHLSISVLDITVIIINYIQIGGGNGGGTTANGSSNRMIRRFFPQEINRRIITQQTSRPKMTTVSNDLIWGVGMSFWCLFLRCSLNLLPSSPTTISSFYRSFAAAEESRARVCWHRI